MKTQALGEKSVAVGLQDVGAHEPLLSQYRFLASAGTKTATVRVYDANGKCVVEETLSVSTTALAITDDAMWTGTPGTWSADYAGIEVVLPEATIYALACDGTPEVTAANGRPLVAGMCLGMVPTAVRAKYEGATATGIPQTPTEVAVSTTVLRCGGATSWTGANANTGQKRLAFFVNLSGTLYAYFKRIATGTSEAGAASATSYDFYLAPGASLHGWEIPAGYDYIVVRSAVSTDKVRYGEELLP